MRFKKGFTLAEILIVLMVIGALAVMTIPALMKGVTEAQFKTAYRKGLNTIVNLAVMEKVSGNLPGVNSNAGAVRLFETLQANLSIKGYVSTQGSAGQTLNSGVTIKPSDVVLTNPKPGGEDATQWWIMTEDNLAYLIQKGGVEGDTTTCPSKMALLADQASKGDGTELAKSACYVIWVDVNGLSAGPNTMVNNGADDGGDATSNYVASGDKMSQLTNDRYPIYLAIDGATAGNQANTVTGRIAGDLK